MGNSCCQTSPQTKRLQMQFNKITLTQACQVIRVDQETTEQALTIHSRLCYLQLTILTSPNQQISNHFSISPLGYEPSTRKKKFGQVYFGNLKGQKQQQTDIVIPYFKRESPQISGRHFKIEFKQNHYYIQDLGVGYGLFRKIHTPVPIRQDLLVNLKGNFLVFGVFQEGEKSILSVKTYFKQENQICWQFYSENFNHRVLYIGRGKKSHIWLDDKAVSLVNSTILWCNGHWMLMDGDAIKKKYSTNGTWVYLNEPWKILNGNILQNGDTIFVAKLYHR